MDCLSPAELLYLKTVAKYPNDIMQNTAKRLNISVGTIKNRRTVIYQKLGVSTMLAAVLLALRTGILTYEDVALSRISSQTFIGD